ALPRDRPRAPALRPRRGEGRARMARGPGDARLSSYEKLLALRDGHTRVLEMIATNAPLGETLATLARLIEAQEADHRREPGNPSPEEEELVTLATHLASIAIEHKKRE